MSVFEFVYAYRELTRRWSRAVLTAAVLALAVAVVVAVVAVSSGLQRTQQEIMNPLRQAGVDLVVTRQPDRQALVSENAAVVTDLSSLGNPGEHFARDVFLPGALLPIDPADAQAVASLEGVAELQTALVLTVAHQEGTLPTIEAEFRTGGETFEVNEDIAPLTDEEQEAIDAAREQALADLRAQNVDPRSEEGRRYVRQAMNAVMPERFRQFRRTFQTPEQIFRQRLALPVTDLQTETWTVAGVTPGTFDSLVGTARLTEGAGLTGAAGEAVASSGFAARRNLSVGDAFVLSGEEFRIIGIAATGQAEFASVDLYISLDRLQALAGRDGQANLFFVTAVDSSYVESLTQEISEAAPGLVVTSDADLASQVTGTLVQVSRLADRLVFTVSAIVMLAAIVTAAVMALTAVQRRVREIGTLKAIGWTDRAISLAVLTESVGIGTVGGLTGALLGAGITSAINRSGLTLTASVPSLLGLGRMSGPASAGFGGPIGGAARLGAARSAVEEIAVAISVPAELVLASIGLAVLAGLIAGAFAVWRALKLRPVEALRQLG